MAKKVLGIDVGGTGIKGAVVNLETGKLTHSKIRILTPSPATPESVALAVKEIVERTGVKKGMVGAGFPAIIKNGVSMSAANIDKSWIGTNVSKVFSKQTKCKFVIANDADVAGVAEMKFGKGKGEKGTVIFLLWGQVLALLFLLMANWFQILNLDILNLAKELQNISSHIRLKK
jgi:polyphosphate glucokinase